MSRPSLLRALVFAALAGLFAVSFELVLGPVLGTRAAFGQLTLLCVLAAPLAYAPSARRGAQAFAMSLLFVAPAMLLVDQ